MCACPQRENGFTPIANEIMEALAGIRISGEARQCLDVIFRKTYGYNKKEDHIALSQFVLLTKMPKPEICRALRKLAEMNIIVIKNANTFGNIYRILKDYSIWKPLAKKPTIGKDAKGRWQKSQSSLAIKGHTKETTTKERISKDIQASPEPYLLINYLTQSLKEFNNLTSLDDTIGKNRQFAYLLIKHKITPEFKTPPNDEQIKQAFDKILSKADQFHKKNMTSFKYIYYNFNKIYGA